MKVSIETTLQDLIVLTRVVIHVLQHVRDRSLTLGVDTTSELANETNLLVGTKPVCGCNKALRANGSRDTVGRCTRTIGLGGELSQYMIR